jgi:hypothetical protein
MYFRQTSGKAISSRTRPRAKSRMVIRGIESRAKTPQEVAEEKAIIERVLARETPAEKEERALRCPHGDMKSSCLRCAGLSETEIQKWNNHRTKGRFIRRDSGTLNHYIPVRISRADCILVSRQEGATSPSEASNWYECLECGRIVEVASGNEKPTDCPTLTCNGGFVCVPEPFQTCQFSPEIRDGAKRKHYADGVPVEKSPLSAEAIVTADLFSDPNSRVQQVGYLRIPLEAPRSTRADAPEWLDLRGNFLRTLGPNRATRGEQILSEFYLQDKTDTQIAETLGWARDSVKKERSALIKQGNEFFHRQPAEYSPSPAIGERNEKHPKYASPCTNHPPRPAVGEGDIHPQSGQHHAIYPAAKAAISPLPSERPYSVSPTNFVAVCSPEPNVLYLHPVFDEGGERFARIGVKYVRVGGLKGFLREECWIPRERGKGGFDGQDAELNVRV